MMQKIIKKEINIDLKGMSDCNYKKCIYASQGLDDEGRKRKTDTNEPDCVLALVKMKGFEKTFCSFIYNKAIKIIDEYAIIDNRWALVCFRSVCVPGIKDDDCKLVFRAISKTLKIREYTELLNGTKTFPHYGLEGYLKQIVMLVLDKENEEKGILTKKYNLVSIKNKGIDVKIAVI